MNIVAAYIYQCLESAQYLKNHYRMLLMILAVFRLLLSVITGNHWVKMYENLYLKLQNYNHISLEEAGQPLPWKQHFPGRDSHPRGRRKRQSSDFLTCGKNESTLMGRGVRQEEGIGTGGGKEEAARGKKR